MFFLDSQCIQMDICRRKFCELGLVLGSRQSHRLTVKHFNPNRLNIRTNHNLLSKQERACPNSED